MTARLGLATYVMSLVCPARSQGEKCLPEAERTCMKRKRGQVNRGCVGVKG